MGIIRLGSAAQKPAPTTKYKCTTLNGGRYGEACTMYGVPVPIVDGEVRNYNTIKGKFPCCYGCGKPMRKCS